MHILRPLSPHLPKFRHLFYSFLILLILLGLCYILSIYLGAVGFFFVLLKKMGFSLGGRALSLALCKGLGFSGGLALAIAYVFQAFLTAEAAPSLGKNMVPSGSAEGGSSSSEASVNQQPLIPELHPPLMDDSTREAELNDRLGIHWAGISYNPDVRESFVRTQREIEKHIEGALVADGYSRETIFEKRHRIRGFLFYPGGTALYESTYVDHLNQIRENGTRQSVPYRRIIRALQSYDLFL